MGALEWIVGGVVIIAIVVGGAWFYCGKCPERCGVIVDYAPGYTPKFDPICGY